MKKITLLLFSLNIVFAFASKPTTFKLPLTFPKDSIELIKIPKEFSAFSVRDFTLSPNKDAEKE